MMATTKVWPKEKIEDATQAYSCGALSDEQLDVMLDTYNTILYLMETIDAANKKCDGEVEFGATIAYGVRAHTNALRIMQYHRSLGRPSSRPEPG